MHQTQPMATGPTRRDPLTLATLTGRCIFSFAIIAIGVETVVCARYVTHSLGPQNEVIPVMPWLPAIPWLAYLFAAIWMACGVGILIKSMARVAAMLLGALLFACTLIFIIPKYTLALGNMSLRTAVFEPLAIACLAVLSVDRNVISAWLERLIRYLLAISLIVFGVDHFLALGFIANLIPSWIPFHLFWVAFFGVAFVATGLSIALDLLQRWSAAGLGAMFGIWVVTLHLPRVLGLYGIPGARNNPNEWSSLFIATALWGGLWALARLKSFVED